MTRQIFQRCYSHNLKLMVTPFKKNLTPHYRRTRLEKSIPAEDFNKNKNTQLLRKITVHFQSNNVVKLKTEKVEQDVYMGINPTLKKALLTSWRYSVWRYTLISQG